MAPSTEEKRAWLAKVPLFAGCPPDVIEQLADVTAEFSFVPDQPIALQRFQIARQRRPVHAKRGGQVRQGHRLLSGQHR